MSDELVVTIKRFDTSLPLPAYQTEKAAALDLCARETTVISAQSIGYIPLNIALKLPKNCFAMVAARSSLHKKGLLLANGIGIGDEDFAGDDDEYKAIVFNFTQQQVEIKKGDRIAQLLILERKKVRWEEVTKLADANRGGIGSTG